METGWRCPQCGPVTAERFALYDEERIFNTHSKRFGPWCRDCGKRVVFCGSEGEQSYADDRRRFAPVLLLSGTCASGKSTLSYLLSERHSLVQIDGDWILALRKAELGRKVDFNEIHSDMLAMAEGLIAMGESVVIAHIILPEMFARYDDYLQKRGIDYRAVILMPEKPVLLERNSSRNCWPHPTPEYWVNKFNDDLLAAAEPVRAYFYDNSHETEEQTVERLWQLLSYPAEQV